MHHVPLEDADRRAARPGPERPVLARGLRQHRPQRDRRPVGRRLRGRGLRPDARTSAPTCATSCATRRRSSCRARSRRRSTAAPTTTARSPASTTSPSSPRERDGVRGFEVRVGGGTSIMPRIAPTLYDFVEADNGDYLEGRRGGLPRSSTARTGCASTAPAPASRCFVDKFGIDELRRHGRRGARGRLGRRARLRRRPDPLRRRRGGRRPGAARVLRARRTATSPSSSASAASNVVAQRQDGLQRRPGQGLPRRPDARAVPRPRPRSCATTRGGYARTTVHQNLVLRWVRDEAVYEVWQRLLGARPRRRPAPTRSTTSSAAPAPTAASSASRARWASTPRSASGCGDADHRPAQRAASTSR